MTPTTVRLPKKGEVWELYEARFLVVSADSSEPSPFQIIKLQSTDNGTVHEILLADFLAIDFQPEQCAEEPDQRQQQAAGLRRTSN